MKFGSGFSDEILKGFSAKHDLPRGGLIATIEHNPLIAREDRLCPGVAWRLLPFALLIILVFFVFLFRLSELQVFEGEKYRAQSESNRRGVQTVEAARGVLTDRSGTVLARNAPAFKVVLTNVNLSPESISSVASLLGMETAAVEERIAAVKETGNTEVVLRRGLSQAEIIRIETSFGPNAANLRTDVDSLRDYVNPETFAQTLGYLGEISPSELKANQEAPYLPGDVLGKDGLETVYEKFLRGTSGEVASETDAAGNMTREISRTEPVAGDNIKTTLDMGLGKLAYSFLADAVKANGASGGAIVAEDPRSGEILLLISYPSFDPGLFSRPLTEGAYKKLMDSVSQPLFNRAVSGTYPPGSVFKLVTATAALEEKVINGSTLIDGPGAISVGSFVFRDWKPEGHGRLTVVEALAQSCDTCFYTVGGGYGSQPGVGPEKISQWAHSFRLGSLLGLDLPGEATGLIGDPAWRKAAKNEAWYIGDTYHLSIGQGDTTATPLQIVSLTATIANGGKLYKPYLVKEIRAADGTLVKEFGPELITKLNLNPQTISLIKEGMAAVDQPGGTAYPMQGFPISSGGKTGTSEYGVPVNGVYKTHAWFTVFAPLEKPEIALTVLVEGGGQGSDDAAPVARKIMDEWLKQRGQ